MRILRIFSLIAAMAIILSVSAFAAAPVITSEPQSVFFPVGTEFPQLVNFSVMATGDDLTYQWQVSRNNGETWTNINISSAYTPTVTLSIESSAAGMRLYRCVVSGSDGVAVSSIVTVSVGAYLMDTIPQMLSWGNTIIDSIFDWIGSTCSCIIDTPLLLIGVSFFALGASIAILSRLLSRS